MNLVVCFLGTTKVNRSVNHEKYLLSTINGVMKILKVTLELILLKVVEVREKFEKTRDDTSKKYKFTRRNKCKIV